MRAAQITLCTAAAAMGLACGPKAPPPEPPPEIVTLSFVGDVMFGRYRDSGFDPVVPAGEDPFSEVKDLLRGDVVIGNLETPVADPLPATSPIQKKHRFGMDAGDLQWLTQAGFTGMNLANNHAFDFGAQAAPTTADLVERAGLTGFGRTQAEQPAVRVQTVEVKGWRIGFIAATTRRNTKQPEEGPWLPYVDGNHTDRELLPLVEEARPAHDLVVVMLHWGDEYRDQPKRHQITQAHALLEAGADLLVGHHGHVLQPFEPVGSGLAAYSLGNFLLENTQKIPRQTAVLEIEAARRDGKTCLRRATILPAYMKAKPWPHPVAASGGMAQRVRQRVRRLGRPLGVRYEHVGENLVWTWSDCFPKQAKG